jgi:hypothetical protein
MPGVNQDEACDRLWGPRTAKISQNSVWLRTGRQGDRGSIPGREKDFSSNLCVQTGSEAHSLLYNGYRGLIPRGKARPGRDADHLPLSSVEVKNE